ncbi:MAG: transcription-repair coupling factor [Anaerolineae bacterium]|nr:transcription-repair coupling factor [Anaerolineae bacterium]
MNELNLSGLLSLIEAIPSYRELLEGLRGRDTAPRSQPHPVTLSLLSSARPYLIAALQRDLGRPSRSKIANRGGSHAADPRAWEPALLQKNQNHQQRRLPRRRSALLQVRPLVVVTARPEQANQLYSQLRLWSAKPESVLLFPEPNALPYEHIAWNIETIQQRIRVLAALLLGLSSRRRIETQLQEQNTLSPVIIASARALMQKTIPVREFQAGVQTLRQGQRISLEKMLAHWVSLGYEPASLVQEPGTFSRRGGIIDVFPPHSAQPVRIELFGNEIESLRLFEPDTQRSQEKVSSFTLVPASEALPQRGPLAAQQATQLDLSACHESAAAEFEANLAALEERQHFKGLEFYIPYLYSQPGNLIDFLPTEGLLIVDDLTELEASMADLEASALELQKTLLEAGELPSELPIPYFTWDELQETLLDRHPLVLGYNDGEEQPLSKLFAPGPRYGGRLKQVLDDWRRMLQEGQRIVVVSRQAQRLAALWGEREAYVQTLRVSETLRVLPPLRSLTIVQGTLAEGWILEAAMCCLQTDAEIFGWSRPLPRRVRRPRAVTPEAFFADMAPDDYVVHIEHGIGIFRGLVELTLDGVKREYLEVEYDGGDKLYVPIHQADRLSRYVGARERRPALHRLGTAHWAQVKARAKRAVEDIARELLELYAAREVVPGHAFPPDHPWQAELEASFAYIETEDQLRAIEEIKADMEKPKPMDRLICGDVGYGKTEVALRAAFKAVMGHKQVAILVPTTVLAQQHYTTFQKRLKSFPVEVEMLSRFRSRREQGEILSKLQAGTMDIVIGTHRLIQKDVAFKDLGLLIIDEEQRFGVTHKEKLKQMRTEVDVLTLTATPIPRTLHMSLTGVRDMSTIDTPPEERLPVKTHVGEYDETLIRKAILRELDRGGQVYFVHNRVMSIRPIAQRLERIVPEATLAIAHGQMREAKLEQVMLDFAAGKIDVLVCTSIIESGLDIPNVNTLIVNRANLFGLADLYQLRGRVGRGARRAYAYLLYDHPHRLTDTARRRLQTILEASELGAGFGIAMRDLEIRGAGDLLGTRQHGHIAAVGFDLYCRLLAQAVHNLKEEPEGEAPSPLSAPLAPSVSIDLPLPAFIPRDYVPHPPLRLRLYRRMAGLVSLDAIEDMERELQDRFGSLPEATANLLYQLRLKVLALRAEVRGISVRERQIVISTDRDLNRKQLRKRLSEQAQVSRRWLRLPLHKRGDIWRWELVRVLEMMAKVARG